MSHDIVISKIYTSTKVVYWAKKSGYILRQIASGTSDPDNQIRSEKDGLFWLTS